MKSRVLNIFWDMDGTLFEFIVGGDIYRKGYFEELGPNRNIVAAAEMIDGMVLPGGTTLRSYTLSNYLTDSPHDCRTEKNNALDRETHFPPGRRFFLPCGSSKWAAVKAMGLSESDAVLIDDYGANLRDWKGMSVKVSRDNADMKKEMQRYAFCISPDLPASEIVNTILSAVGSM